MGKFTHGDRVKLNVTACTWKPRYPDRLGTVCGKRKPYVDGCCRVVWDGRSSEDMIADEYLQHAGNVDPIFDPQSQASGPQGRRTP